MENETDLEFKCTGENKIKMYDKELGDVYICNNNIQDCPYRRTIIITSICDKKDE
jgi:hypothetical protein